MTNLFKKFSFLRKSDIDAEAAAILRSACQAVQAILARRSRLDREGQHNRPLVVLAGEHHSMPAHYVHHMLVLKGLVESGEKIVFGYEEEHNLLSQKFFATTNRQPDPATARLIQESDPDGTLALECLLRFWGSPCADHSNNIASRYLLYHNENPVHFTDAARLRGYLDPDDPFTAQSMQDCQIVISPDIRVTSLEGVRVRNYHMASMMGTFAAVQNARIAVQRCGNNHIAGLRYGGYSACHSLSACFKAQNIPVLAMPIFHRGFDENHMPVDHKLLDDEKLFRIDVPEKEAIYDPLKDKPFDDNPADFQCRANEATWVNALLKRTGLESECMSVEEYWKQQKSLVTVMREQFEEWGEEFFPATRNGVNNNNNPPVLQTAEPGL